jgi:hypothetical protein
MNKREIQYVLHIPDPHIKSWNLKINLTVIILFSIISINITQLIIFDKSEYFRSYFNDIKT